MPTVRNKSQVISQLSLHFTIHHAAMELEQFKSGLESLGVLEMMQKSPNIFMKEFCTRPVLNFEVLKSFYKIKYSGVERQKEKEDKIIKNWYRLLKDVEQGNNIAGVFCLCFFACLFVVHK